jgi:hypothetical protein
MMQLSPSTSAYSSAMIVPDPPCSRTILPCTVQKSPTIVISSARYKLRWLPW